MDVVSTLAMGDEELVGMVAIGGGLTIGIVAVVGGLIKSTLTAKMRETTKREIAAYVAEGSMTQEEGERLLNAGPRERGCG